MIPKPQTPVVSDIIARAESVQPRHREEYCALNPTLGPEPPDEE